MYQLVAQPAKPDSPRADARDRSQLRHLLKDALDAMHDLRERINAAFLTEDRASSNQPVFDELEEAAHHVRQVVTQIRETAGVDVPDIKALVQQRREAVDEEVNEVARLAESSAHHSGQPVIPSATATRLCELIRAIRDREQQQEFHAQLLRTQQEVIESSGEPYSLENFAYGSTPFSTWMQLLGQEVVADTINSMRHEHCETSPRFFTVFGSSSGSLVLFTALAWGIPAEGVEILPFLHAEAERFRERAGISPAQCGFTCAPMLSASLARTRVLVLTSQCWDAPLYARVLRKVDHELPDDALVLDYKKGLQHSARFKLLARLDAQKVSWTTAQPLFVFGHGQAGIEDLHM